MFTGLVEETGQVRSVQRAGRSLHLTVAAKRVLEGLQPGDSVAVNGVCLTVVRCVGDTFTADVMPETYQRTNLRFLTPGALVNLERALALGNRLGGHIVQGHVDGTGTIEAMVPDEIAIRMTVKAPPEVLRYLVPKGSVAVDGISLTVVDVGADRFQVSLIPHTVAVTNLSRRRPGDVVNLEADILAKYVERLLTAHLPEGRPAGGGGQGGLTEAFLREHGF
ncbi:MAG TPA: riboflavin synthase [Symbiobacteriaceae bacterium]